jgi:hypothetical protein
MSSAPLVPAPADPTQPTGLTSPQRRQAWRAFKASADVSVAEAAAVAGISRTTLASIATEHRWREARERHLAGFSDPSQLPSLAIAVVASHCRRSAALADLLDAKSEALGANPSLADLETVLRLHTALSRTSLELVARMLGTSA